MASAEQKDTIGTTDVEGVPSAYYSKDDDGQRENIRSMVEAELLDPRYAQTQRGLKSRHVQMMAIGGTIGTGLFVGSGEALAIGIFFSFFLPFLL